MKKVLAVIAAALAACMLAVFVGCGAADVEGKTCHDARYHDRFCERKGNYVDEWAARFRGRLYAGRQYGYDKGAGVYRQRQYPRYGVGRGDGRDQRGNV